jgi:hypothetical protein
MIPISIVDQKKQITKNVLLEASKATKHELDYFYGMAKPIKRKERRDFIEKLRALAHKHKSKIIFHKKEWVYEASSGEKISMEKGYYITTKDGVLHKVTYS